MSMMKSIQISNKFKNLSILLLAKEEHKKKFNEIIEYKEYQYIHNDYVWFNRSLKENIEWIKRNQIGFYIKLRVIIGTKFEKYITKRKITIPKLDDITEYNCETDCPICFETIGDNTNGCMEGDNCNHTICSNCRDKIVNDTNKCPICREKLDDNITDEEQSDNGIYWEQTETDEDESDWGDDDDNLRPTSILYIGRRWFNTETNTIEYWTGTEWTTTLIRPRMSNFIIRNYGYDNTLEPKTCCLSCGLQRTREVNDFMDTTNPILRGNFFHFGECYDCNIITGRMEDHFNTMEYPH